MTAGVRSALLVVSAAGCVIVLALTTTIAEPLPPLPLDPFWLAWFGLPLVGAYILVKRPGNPVGGTVLAMGVCAALSAGCNLAAVYGLARPDYLVLINQLAFAPFFVLLPLLLLVFPSGTLPSARWRIPVVAAIVLDFALIVWFTVRPVEYSFNNVDFFANPLGMESLAGYDSVVISVLRFALYGFVAAVIVYASSLSADDRPGAPSSQVGHCPALAAPLLFMLGISLEEANAELGNLLVMAAIVGGGNGIAVGIGVAILRHRLYEIDRVRPVHPGSSPGASGGGPALQPSRYDAGLVVESLSGLLRERVDPEGVVDDWMEVVEETMQPTAVGI